MEGSQYYLTMAVTGVGTFVLAALAFVLAFNNRITEAFNMGKSAKDTAQDNKESIAILTAKVDLVARESHTMEVEVASKISTLTNQVENLERAVSSSEQRISRSIEQVLHKLTDRT